MPNLTHKDLYAIFQIAREISTEEVEKVAGDNLYNTISTGSLDYALTMLELAVHRHYRSEREAALDRLAEMDAELIFEKEDDE